MHVGYVLEEVGKPSHHRNEDKLTGKAYLSRPIFKRLGTFILGRLRLLGSQSIGALLYIHPTPPPTGLSKPEVEESSACLDPKFIFYAWGKSTTRLLEEVVYSAFVP